MQELRLVGVSEDGTYAVLAAPRHGGRFSLPIDDRLRVVARGQFSRLAQYEIEVESPLRPKEIQDRIRAGETAEEVADAAGVPSSACAASRARYWPNVPIARRKPSARPCAAPGTRGRGRRSGDLVTERLAEFGAAAADAEWDSRKRSDGGWQVRLAFTSGSRPHLAEWVYDPHRKHVAPADDTAARLCLPEADLPEATSRLGGAARATVTPIASRLGSPAQQEQDPGQPAEAVRTSAAAQSRAAEVKADTGQAAPVPRERPARKAAGGRSRRSSVPSWDEIMFGTSRPND